MARSRGFYVALVLALLGDAFCIPTGGRPGNRIDQEDDVQTGLTEYGSEHKDLKPANSERIVRDDGTSFAADIKEGESKVQTTTTRAEYATPVTDDDSDEDDDFESMNTAPSAGGGSNIFSLLRLASALFPSSSGANEDGSDLGTLLATISGIVANLSGDGIDLNALIGSGIGLFVGLLSEGEENPGAVIASYLLTSLDTITGGGSKNNGAFFGKFLSKLIRGTSAGGDPDASSEEGKEPEKDSAGFFSSFLMAALGEMSKGSSKSSSCGSSCGHPDSE